MPDTLPLGGPVGHLSRQTQPGTSIPAHTHVGPQCQQEEQAGPRATKNALVIANTLFQKREDSTHGHHQMVNTEIRLIIFFAAKDGEALYSQQKQDQELTVGQTMNFLLPNSD